MKKIIPFALSAFIFIAVFGGSGFNALDLIDFVSGTITTESTYKSPNETANTAEDVKVQTKLAQTTAKKGIQFFLTRPRAMQDCELSLNRYFCLITNS